MRTAESKAKIVGYWRSSGLLRAWEPSFQAEAIAREDELFGGIARERRGLDDDPPEDGRRQSRRTHAALASCRTKGWRSGARGATGRRMLRGTRSALSG